MNILTASHLFTFVREGTMYEISTACFIYRSIFAVQALRNRRVQGHCAAYHFRIGDTLYGKGDTEYGSGYKMWQPPCHILYSPLTLYPHTLCGGYIIWHYTSASLMLLENTFSFFATVLSWNLYFQGGICPSNVHFWF